MIRSFLAFAFLFLLVISPALAEEAKKEFKDTEYLALVDAAIKDPDKGNWTDIRNLYMQSSFYDHALRKGISGSMFSDLGKTALESKKPEDIAAYKAWARNYAGAIDTHMEAYNLLTQKKADFVSEAYEKAAFKGLGDAILTSGDGKTLQTAIRAASTSEQYFLMRSWYGLTPRSKTLENHQGKMYDVHRVANDKGEDVGEIFFDISLYFGRMELPQAAQAQFDKINEQMKAEAAKRPPPAVAPEDQKYLDAVDAAIKDPAAADWNVLRELYIGTSFYKRVGGINLAHYTRDMTGYLLSRMTPEAIERYKEFLRQHYAGAGTQTSAQRIAQLKKPDFINLAATQNALDGIMRAVLSSGDGKTPATAYKTISVDEASHAVTLLFTGKPDLKVEEHGGEKLMAFRGKAKADATQDALAYFRLDPRALPEQKKPEEKPAAK